MADQETHLALSRLLRLRDRREPLVVQIAEWVGAGIIEGRLEPGQDLNSVDLSRRFDTSRTPVREALMLLEQEGLVEIKARRRPRVAAPTLEGIRDIYQVRRQLLSMLAGLLVERATDTELAGLRTRIERMRSLADAGDVDAYFWDHVQLQERMTEIAGNTTLKQMLDSLALRTLMLRHLSLTRPGRLAHSVDDQERLIQACEERDRELASALIAGATVRALRAVEEQIEQDTADRRRNPTRQRRAAG
ncbi:GntR family transcriptional regulator [Actinomadura madurae]|uniref:GntR family transcriptional regulator n=1 Tax=Actinomadura madurae TaxID=1993 RepID=UPI0020D21810|nr:GntR family transcriptional regulator [Actinomadura madurae]MCP9955582.1 GntR family transcriptional regulator [Actinomadura madurae]MCP9972320.1 GntR family transcriptional regulator [Actinomadura madurae]MCQ0003622.1 GntR family transcriptional regulator [Actinomadura madurae]MCQ0021015.1 GntR family transcriptional regulator [Actinomadura madurae]